MIEDESGEVCWIPFDVEFERFFKVEFFVQLLVEGGQLQEDIPNDTGNGEGSSEGLAHESFMLVESDFTEASFFFCYRPVRSLRICLQLHQFSDPLQRNVAVENGQYGTSFAAGLSGDSPIQCPSRDRLELVRQLRKIKFC